MTFVYTRKEKITIYSWTTLNGWNKEPFIKITMTKCIHHFTYVIKSCIDKKAFEDKYQPQKSLERLAMLINLDMVWPYIDKDRLLIWMLNQRLTKRIHKPMVSTRHEFLPHCFGHKIIMSSSLNGHTNVVYHDSVQMCITYKWI